MKNRTGKILTTLLVMIAVLFMYRPEQAMAAVDPYDYSDASGPYTYVSREKAEQMMFSMADGTYPWCSERIIYEGSEIFPYKQGGGTTYFEQQLVSSYRRAVNNDYYIFNTKVTGNDGKTYTATMMGPSGYIYNGNKTFTLEEFMEADAELSAVAASLNSGNTYERLKKVLDWVCNRYEYGESEGGAGYMNICTSLRTNKAVCREYAETVQLLADKMGLECYMWLPDKKSHALNIVFLDGQYYFLDATFYDTTDGVSGFFEGLDSPRAYEKYDADDVAAHGITIAATSYQTSDRKTNTTPTFAETSPSNNTVVTTETEWVTTSYTEHIPPQTTAQETEAYENEIIYTTGVAINDIYPEDTEAAENTEGTTVSETEEETENVTEAETETKKEKETTKSQKETNAVTEAENQTDTVASSVNDTDNTPGETGKKSYAGFIIAGVILLAGAGTAVVLTVRKRRTRDENNSEE